MKQGNGSSIRISGRSSNMRVGGQEAKHEGSSFVIAAKAAETAIKHKTLTSTQNPSLHLHLPSPEA
jgi:hypothetical protein